MRDSGRFASLIFFTILLIKNSKGTEYIFFAASQRFLLKLSDPVKT